MSVNIQAFWVFETKIPRKGGFSIERMPFSAIGIIQATMEVFSCKIAVTDYILYYRWNTACAQYITTPDCNVGAVMYSVDIYVVETGWICTAVLTVEISQGTYGIIVPFY